MRSLRARLARRGDDERGASLVEFALVFPIFALLLFGLIDFGLVFGGMITLDNAVNAAGRQAAISNLGNCTSATDPMVCAAQTDIGSLPGVVPGSLEVQVCFPSSTAVQGTCVSSTGAPAVNSSPQAGSPVLVCAQATVQSTTGVTAPFLSGRAIHAHSELLLEQDPVYQAGASPSGYVCP